MILNQNQQSDAQLIGDIQNNKVGIDTNNLDFITSLLTTNLYSQPIQSFIREAVANGWDSHVEAGTINKPVIIRVYSDDRSYIHLAVRDYGTGLSIERFNEIYLNIGASTKRTSNQYIGAFGLGRWAQLAIADTSHITNYYNGICTKYIAYKDGGKICVDKLFESPTEDENGLEIDVNVNKKVDYSYDVRKEIAKGIKQLTFYNNVYIDDPEHLIRVHDYTSCEDFNQRKIADFKTFKVCNRENIRNSLLMGNVLYPIETSYIEKWFKGTDSVPFAIKCNIGDVDITPSREALLYSQKTINTIDKICQEALEEFKSIAKINFGSDFKTIEQYYTFSNTNYIPITLKEFDDYTVVLSIPTDKMSYYDLSDQITINGQAIPNDLLEYYRKFRYLRLPNPIVTYNYCNDRFYIKHNELSLARYVSDYYPRHNIRLIDELLKPITKKYWTNELFEDHDGYGYYFLNKKYIRLAFIKLVRNFCESYKITPTDPIIKFIFKDFMTNYTNVESYNNWDVPQAYIDAAKAEAKQNKIAAQQKARKCVIYNVCDGRNWNTVGYDTDSYDLDKIKRFKGTVFFAEKDSNYLEALYRIIDKLNVSRVICVAVAPSNLSLLRDIKNCIELNRIFVEKNNLISKICTGIYLAEKWNIKGNGLYFIDRPFNKEFDEFYYLLNAVNQCDSLLTFVERNEAVLQEFVKIICTTYYQKGWLNYRMLNGFESNKTYIKLNSWFSDNNNYKETVLCLYDYLTKHNISNKKRFDQVKNKLKPIFNEYTPNTELPHFNIG